MVPSPISRPDTLVGVDALIRADFETFSDLWFARLIWSSVIVAIGIFFEGPEVFHEVAGVIRHTLHICKPEKDKKSAVVLCGLIGWLLVAGGVAGEGFCEGFIWKADGILRSFNNMLVAEATKEAGDAVLGAATANMQVAEAKRRTAELDKQAEELRAENLRLEAIIAPRSLSVDQQKRIADACRKFQNHGVMVTSYGMDGESAVLGAQIIAALQSVNIIVADGRGSIIVSGGFDIGVHVRGPQVENEFASALGQALSSIGKLAVAINDPEPRMGATMGGGGAGFTPGSVFITVMVGIKPLPILPKASKATAK